MKVQIKDIFGKAICEIEAKSEFDFSGIDLSGENLRFANLRGKNLAEANLVGADLGNADLGWTNLFHSNLGSVNLENANLEWSNLFRANLKNANLKNANLSEANLGWANLKNAILTEADLRFALGNGEEIKTFQTDPWPIVIAGDQMAIGCQQHSLSEWMNFSDEKIEGMHDEALEWWRKWKPIIQAMIAD